MIKILCSVFDSTVAYFAPPFTTHNEGSALRDFAHACKDPASMLSKSPSDFSLVLLATFDDETGDITPLTRKTLGTAAQYTPEAL